VERGKGVIGSVSVVPSVVDYFTTPQLCLNVDNLSTIIHMSEWRLNFQQYFRKKKPKATATT
jgi:hypothetical protein